MSAVILFRAIPTFQPSKEINTNIDTLIWLVDDKFSKHVLMAPTIWRNTNGFSLK
jgi:hypothetical protein